MEGLRFRLKTWEVIYSSALGVRIMLRLREKCSSNCDSSMFFAMNESEIFPIFRRLFLGSSGSYVGLREHLHSRHTELSGRRHAAPGALVDGEKIWSEHGTTQCFPVDGHRAALEGELRNKSEKSRVHKFDAKFRLNVQSDR